MNKFTIKPDMLKQKKEFIFMYGSDIMCFIHNGITIERLF